uniref:Transmembrane protein n=1 Tax=Glycine max TaxID=3847 RepID=A0A368UIF1_SOYBN
MSDHHPRLHHLRSTSHLLKESFSSFSSNFLTFLFLSLLTLSFRTLVETGTAHVTSFIDRDPSLRALLSRLDLAGNSHNHHNSNNGHHDLPSPNNLRHRRRPFLHLTRVGTLDDDFFSGDDDDARSLFGSIPKPSSNATLLALSPFKTTSAFSDLLADDGIRVSQVIRSGTTFNTQGLSSLSSHHDDDDDDDDSEEKEEPKKEKVDLQFFVKGIEVGRRDAAALFFLVSFLSAAYGWVILVFLVTYSWVLGVVFVSVVNDLLGRFSSVTVLVWEGSRLGLKRLSGFILMRWAVRDALTQLLGSLLG